MLSQFNAGEAGNTKRRSRYDDIRVGTRRFAVPTMWCNRRRSAASSMLTRSLRI